jgi:hypothetical protein
MTELYSRYEFEVYPDYDASTAKEMYQRAHEDRQQLRG